MKRLGLSLPLFVIMVGCIAETPQEPPRREIYKNEPVTFSAPYDDVWAAAVTAIEELKWDIKNADKGMGIIQLRTSYVYNTSFGKYERVYLEPKNGEFEHSKIKPYLRKISYYEQDAPPIPEFVRETLNVKVKAISPYETQIKINYEIMPYYNYRIGYLGTVRSKGYVEKRLFKRIQEILTKKGQ
ncbi:MAG: hypothetical protein C4291_09825 [Candidatus Dadabacteria bacterium]